MASVAAREPTLPRFPERPVDRIYMEPQEISQHSLWRKSVPGLNRSRPDGEFDCIGQSQVGGAGPRGELENRCVHAGLSRNDSIRFYARWA
jgi:hypothetical protein